MAIVKLIEAQRIVLSNSDVVKVTFTKPHTNAPNVIATAEGNDAGDVNIYIKQISTKAAIFKFSAAISGYLHVHAVSLKTQ